MKFFTSFLFLLAFAANSFSQAPTINAFPVGSATVAPFSGATGKTMTITGTNFTGATAVSFGGTPASSFTVVSATVITAIVGSGNTGSVSVTTPLGTANQPGFTYLPLSRIVTDFGGYWSSTTSSANSVIPDSSHNLLGFNYNNTFFSTGVNDALLTSKGVAFTQGNYRAFPVAGITGNNPGDQAIYLAIASKADGDPSTGNLAGVASSTIRRVLIDGVRGLDLGTGVTNLPASAIMTFNITSIDAAQVSGLEPEILITQIADPSSANDKFDFIDETGNTVGNFVMQNMTVLTSFGTYKLDLFGFPTGSSYNTATPTSVASSNTTRGIRLVGFKLTDFGITIENAANVKALRIRPSGNSDYAFIAYNARVITVQPNISQNDATTASNVCSNGTAVLSVIGTASSGGALSYTWEQSTNGGTTWSALTNGGNFSGATTASLNIINPINNNKYRATVAESGSTSTNTSAVFTLTVSPPSVGGTVSGSTTVCAGTNSTTLTLSGITGSVVRWESSVNNFSSSTIIANTTSGLTVTNLIATTKYRAVVQSGACSFVYSSVATITVLPLTVSTFTYAGPYCKSEGVATVTSFTGITGGSYSSTAGLSINATTGAVTLSASTAGIYTVTYSYTEVNGCANTATANITILGTDGLWKGAQSVDWNNAANWCSNTVPTASSNVIISAGTTYMPSITTNVSCNNLTIQANAVLTTSSAGTLQIAGTLVNTGTMTNNGTTTFIGTGAAQTFTGVTNFYNLTVNNTNGVVLPANIVVNDVTLTTGTLSTNYNIDLKGNWLNNVSATAFNQSAGTVNVAGTTPQTIGGSFESGFYNLTTSNAGSSITLANNINIAGNLSISSGTFNLAGFTANRITPGGTLTVANNATLQIGGTGTYPVNYTTNVLIVASTVEYSGTNQTVANQLYGNLKLSSSGGAAIKTFPGTALTVAGNLSSILGSGTSLSFTAASNITVNGNVSIGASTTFNGSSYAHNIGGNWVNNGTFNGNTGTITFTGSGAVVSGAGAQNFNNLTVAAALVSFSTGSVTLTGNLTTTGSGSFTQASGGTLTMSGTGKTISGTGISIDNLTVSGTVTTSVSFLLTGNLAVNGSFTSANGTITMSGSSKTISGPGTMAFYQLNPIGSITTGSDFSIASGLLVNGSFSASAGIATFTGTSFLSGTANLYNAAINGTSLQLAAGSVLGIANTLTITSGTLNVSSSGPNTVDFNGTGAQSINAISYSNLVLSNGNTKTAVGALTTVYDLTIATGTTFNPSTYTHSVYGNWINNGTFTAGTSTVQFLGPATAFITGATTFNILTSNTSSSTTELILQSNVSAAIVNMTNGIISTGTNTLTITNTRTGNGFIYGNIQRTHAFTTGVSYDFEGPNNTITFAAVSGVSSITVSVAEVSVSDFPFGGAINRVYDISVPSGTYTATLRLHYEDDELNGNNESSMGLWHYNGSTWGSIGKSSNSTSLNYVEQTGLTSITNRWTASDNSNLVRWNGNTSSDWNTAANWTILQGSATAPPSSSDIVDLGSATFTNQPTITNNVTVKGIVFGSAKAVTLTLGGGGALTTLGGINGIWTSNATHTININNQALTANGNLDLSDGTTGHAINLNINTGTVTTLGSLSEAGGANITFSGAGSLNIFQNFDYTSGTFTAGSGTVTYNGTENQEIANINYNNLTVNKASGLSAINNNTNIAGNLLVSAGELDNYSTTSIVGNVTIDAGGTFNNHMVLHVQGNWNNNGTYTGTGSGVFFDGSGAQSISASTFNNLNINKPVGSSAVLTGNILISGDLTVTSGTLNIKSFTCDRNVQGGAATVGDSATIIIGGNNAPVNFTSGSLGSASTVIFDGTQAQVLFSAGNFGHIILRNAGVKTLVTPMTVNGNLTIESGANFNAGSNTITLNGNWINNGTFTPSSGTLILGGIGKTVSGNTAFNKVTITGTYSNLSNITYNDLLHITSTGSISSGTGIFTTLNGDLINNGVLYTLGTTTFSGNVLQTLSLINAVQTVALIVNFNGSVSPVLNSTSAPQYGYLNINNTGGVNPSVGWTILYALTVGSGASFNFGASTHNIYGAVTNNGTITSSGTVSFLPATAVTLNLGTSFSSTGRVYFGGAGAITLAGTPASFHNVNINNTNIAGITPSSAWNLTGDLRVVSGSILNAGNYTHFIGGNISSSGTINRGTSTFTLNGTGAQNINTVSAFNNLTINKAAGSTTLSSNAMVNGVLNFAAGNLQTGNYRLIQPSSASVTGAAQNTGWVQGNLQKYIATGATVKTFEIGDASNYTPVALAFENVTSANSLTVNTTPTDHPVLGSSPILPSKSVNRYWTLIDSGVVFTNYNATFNFVPSDIDGGTTTSAFKTALYNGSSWSLPVAASPNATNIQATGVTSFGDFAIGDACNTGTTIAYTGSPFCANAETQSVILTGTSGGVFSADPGVSVDPATGSINISKSVTGISNVDYTIDAQNGCPQFITSATITINPLPVAFFAYAGPYCKADGIATINTFTGTTGGIYSSIPGLTINSSTGAITLSSSDPGTYTVTYSFSANGCSNTTTAEVTVGVDGSWTGTANSDWNNVANWCSNTVPTAESNVVIKASAPFKPVVNSGSITMHDLELEEGVTLNISGASLTLNGQITGAGTMSTSATSAITIGGTEGGPAGTIIFTPGANTIGSFTLNRMGADALAIIGSPLVLTDVLTLSSGELNTGNFLTLASTALQTARVAPVATGAAITGHVTIERFVPARRAWRLIGAPIASSDAPTINAAWQEGATTSTGNPNPGYGTHITGGTLANGFDRSPTNSTSIRYLQNNSWQALGTTNATAITQYPGYFFFIRGNRSYNISSTSASTTPSPTVLRVTGNLNYGDQPAKTIAAAGFTLLSNPYASSVSFSSLAASGSNIKNRLYVWDPKLGGGSGVGAYVVFDWTGSGYTAIPGGSSMTSDLQAGQAFFVQSNDGLTAGSLQFKEAQKVTPTSSAPFGRGTSSDAALMINFKVANADQTYAIVDGVMARFNEDYSNAINSDDAVKSPNFNENLSIASNGKLLTIERRAVPNPADTLKLNLSGLKTSGYQVEIIPQNFESTGLTALLYDRFKETLTPLNSADTIRYTLTTTSNALSKASNRLSIVYTVSATLPVTIKSIKAKATGATSIEVEWEVENEQSLSHYEVQKLSSGNVFNSIGKVLATAGGTSKAVYNFTDINAVEGDNIYRVKSVDLDGRVQYTGAVKVSLKSKLPSGITVYPNPVKNSKVILHLNNMKQGVYIASLFNSIGQKVFSTSFNHQEGTASQTLLLSTRLAKGIYQLQVVSNNGIQQTITLNNE